MWRSGMDDVLTEEGAYDAVQLTWLAMMADTSEGFVKLEVELMCGVLVYGLDVVVKDGEQ
jgi:hypothetical protein